MKVKNRDGLEVWINPNVISHVEQHIDLIPTDLSYSKMLEIQYTRIDLIDGGHIISSFESFQDIINQLGD